MINEIENDKFLNFLKIVCILLYVCLIILIVLDSSYYFEGLSKYIKIKAGITAFLSLTYWAVLKYKLYKINEKEATIQTKILQNWPFRGDIKVAIDG